MRDSGQRPGAIHAESPHAKWAFRDAVSLRFSPYRKRLRHIRSILVKNTIAVAGPDE